MKRLRQPPLRLAAPERLEVRLPLAIVQCTYVNDVVSIRTDNASTNVVVETRYEPSSEGHYAVKVTDTTAKKVWNFSGWTFSRIDFRGGAGNDSLTTKEDSMLVVPIRAYGGGGKDTLRGGSFTDELFGGPGDDSLYGNGGDDQLHGDAGNDRLFGGHGDDRLYGGPGKDSLSGEAGNDGLFGGVGEKDQLRGGPGADRFLTISTYGIVRRQKYYKSELHRWRGTPSYRNIYGDVLEDAVVDRSAKGAGPSEADVVVHLRNPSKAEKVGGATFNPGRWKDADILPVDEAFAALVRSTNNNRLLTRSDGSDPVWLRYGSKQSGSGNAIAWNSWDAIAMTDRAMSSHDQAVSTTFHEVAHYWDDPQSNPYVNAFRGLSDWRNSPAAGHTRSADGQWYYRSDAQFYRSYGKTNPYEDFATCFEAAYAYVTGKIDSSRITTIEAKVNNIFQFIASRSTYA